MRMILNSGVSVVGWLVDVNGVFLTVRQLRGMHLIILTLRRHYVDMDWARPPGGDGVHHRNRDAQHRDGSFGQQK